MGRVRKVSTGGAIAGHVARLSDIGGEPNYNTLSSRDEAFDPRDEQIGEILRVIDDQIEFGEPQNPNDPTNTQLAGAATTTSPEVTGHNGTRSNILGSWVEIELTSAAITDVICTHNLFLHDPDYVVPVTGEPNCRWLNFGVMHDGTNGDGTSVWELDVFFEGGAVTANAITLRFRLANVGTTYTIGANNQVLVTLFFIRATRGQ